MPSLGIHLLVGDEVVQKLSNSSDEELRELGANAAAHPGMAALGAIGADLLYYTQPGISGTFTYLLAKILNGFAEIGNLLDDSRKPLQAANQTALAELLKQFAGTVKVSFATISSRLEVFIVDLNNTVLQNGLMYGSSAEQKNLAEDKWNWGDLLHDRLVGEFAGRLMEQAARSGNGGVLAFATTYYAHIATDTVGHPYVNAVAGGPARGWDLRHTLAEKFMDADVYFRLRRDINSSEMHRRFDGVAGSVDFVLLAQILSQLSKDFAGKPPGFPLPQPFEPGDVQDALRNMTELFKLVTASSFLPPPKAPSLHLPPLPGQAGSITNALGSLMPHGARPHGITDWLKMLLFFLAAAPAVMTDLANFLVQCVEQAVDYPVEGALYLIQTLLYQTYRQARYFLVTSGLLFPLQDEMTGHFAEQFTRSPLSTGEDRYPHVPPDGAVTHVTYNGVQLFSQDLSAMDYPVAAAVEYPTTRASIYPKGIRPEYFIRDLQMDEEFVRAWSAAATPDDLRTVVNQVQVTPGQSSAGGFGNAVDFTIFLLTEPHLADVLNTDADRGYAYKRWTCKGGLSTGVVQELRFF